MTQNEAILKYLKNHVGLTQLQALDKLGVMRLPARISELREMGFDIVTLRKEVRTRYGKTNVAEYRLIEH